ncbi:prenyltransferase/squalene oxidase repeat-containing protein [Gimesia panareensis]|uniref:prenyltransferase/squalene oxidase repeat-containing protein n=1 Tax=Gimesia panareensis TaxID=2527978 RepID=UPI00118C9E6E|nr:prenyltransferase/squalene oxidase repeat-containing protein [Gimesia panareensis]QDU48894.1 Prenyltransferase and squalene oxidase repeat protein [Gimesia panareensis]
MFVFRYFCVLLVSASVSVVQAEPPEAKFQYKSPEIQIPEASAGEPVLKEFSLERADRYLEQGTAAWSAQRKCVSCHTNGMYLISRPELTAELGPPTKAMRDFFVAELRKLQGQDRERLLSGIRPTQIAYVAAGLAKWDQHVSRKLSPETDEALRFMLSVQSDDGSWGNADCWPPFESSSYQGATVAAQAIAAAPGWREALKDEALQGKIKRLLTYLREKEPPHDYGRLLLLWTAADYPELLTAEKKQALISMVRKHQLPDGGWSLRTFAAPGAWGKGNRAEKLQAEPEFDTASKGWKNLESDGHQTGLAILVLRESGVKADDPQIRKGIQWLLSHQRDSGRWWTRSLNTDRWHFITYSGTFYPLLALKKCNALPALQQTSSR